MPPSSPWTALHAQFHRTLRARQLLPTSQCLLVAVSGGQDSLCLMQLLLDLQPKWHWQLAIAHCDHRWRSDSQANADYIEHLAHTWQVPFYRRSAEQIPQTEAAARQWRYQVLTEMAQTHNYPYLVTGHTASDRAETLLYNLIRGSGSDGLQALTWQRPLSLELTDFNGSCVTQAEENQPVTLVRPLLEITRQQTGQFCQDRQLNIWWDSTNDDLHYARNRIRQELLPYLQHHFNPQAELALAQTAELLRAEVNYLEALTHQLLETALSTEDLKENHLKLNRVVLRQAPLALQRRVMRKLLQNLTKITPNFEQIEKLITLIKAPNRTQTDPFPGGVIAVVQDQWIVFKNT